MIDFEKIYSIYFKDVYYFLLSLSKDKEVAEDITSETFFKALKNIENFRGDSSIKTYLFQIAKNSYFDYLRKNKKIVSIDDFKSIEKDSINTEDEFLEREESAYLRNLVETLKEPHKSIIKLRIWEELSFKDIGTVYGKSENWACVTFHRAKKILKNKLEE